MCSAICEYLWPTRVDYLSNMQENPSSWMMARHVKDDAATLHLMSLWGAMTRQRSFSQIGYRYSTELSKYVWDLKEREREFSIQWSILKRAACYSGCRKSCYPCLKDKHCIFEDNEQFLKMWGVFEVCPPKSDSWRENLNVEVRKTSHAHKQLTEIIAV